MHAVHLVAAGTCEEVTVARLVSRINRMHGAMSALTRMPDEERVAESILGLIRHLNLDDSPRNPSGIIASTCATKRWKSHGGLADRARSPQRVPTCMHPNARS